MAFNKQNTDFTISIIVAIISAFVFVFLFLFLGINHRKDVYENSKKLASEISKNAANETQQYFSSATMITKSLEQKIVLIRKLNGSRKEVRQMLYSSISENHNLLGVWTLWEPNAFDNNDNLYKDDSLFNDQGTLGISFFRDYNKINYEVMTYRDYEQEYYTSPKKNKDIVITEPYHFVYTGYNHVFLGTTISIPIIVNNEYLGAIGTDIDLGYLQKELSKIKPYETGYLSLISNRGKILTHTDTSLIKENIFDLFDENDSLSTHAILQGRELAIEVTSEFTGKRVYRLFYPIEISGSKPWSIMIEIPLDKAASLSNKLLIIAITILFVGLSLLFYLIRNIIKRKRYEQDLLMAKMQVEESNRLKTAFLNNLSHEIRTPLNGILGFTELLLDTSITNEDAKAYQKIVKNSSNQLLSIISDVVELAKIQTRHAKFTVSSFEIEKQILEVIETFQHSAKEKQIELKTKFKDLHERNIISTDREKFKQVLTHLLNNAVKFTQKGIIEIGCKNQDDNYMFYVKDTGIGINPENVKRIFESFQQEDYTISRKYGGLGVGLSISKAFVDIMGGVMYLDSKPGEGTTFYFTVPVN